MANKEITSEMILPKLTKENTGKLVTAMLNDLKWIMSISDEEFNVKLAKSYTYKRGMLEDITFRDGYIIYVTELNNPTRGRYVLYNAGIEQLYEQLGKKPAGSQLIQLKTAQSKYDIYRLCTLPYLGWNLWHVMPKALTGDKQTKRKVDVVDAIYKTGNHMIAGYNGITNTR